MGVVRYDQIASQIAEFFERQYLKGDLMHGSNHVLRVMDIKKALYTEAATRGVP